MRQINLIVEPIRRKEEETFFAITSPKPSENQVSYPWEQIGTQRQITKEFFRCRGNPLNPPIQVKGEGQKISYHLDCEGIQGHSLPIKGEKEFIYPILIDLLNMIQEKTNKRVIITSAHRCPTHNTYVDPSKSNRTSKHLIGAQVDFYVEGMESKPLAVMSLIELFYQNDAHFSPLEQKDHQWVNREITATLRPPHKHRNIDNQHPYPYLTIEVKYDRQKKRPVHFSWHQGYHGFYRNY